MNKWEYKTFSYELWNEDTTLEETLNRLGEEGWQLCAYQQNMNTGLGILKREKGKWGSFY